MSSKPSSVLLTSRRLEVGLPGGRGVAPILTGVVQHVLFFLFLVLAWQMAIEWGFIQRILLPTPLEVGDFLWRDIESIARSRSRSRIGAKPKP